MNWGTKIFFALAVFMIGIVAAGVYMVSRNSDSLVENDYYERGINYDEVYLRRQNVQTHQARPSVSITGDTLHVRFVHGGNTGDLLLRRASDQSQDVNIPFSVAGDVLQVPVRDLRAGAWDLQLTWQSGELAFQYEQKIYLDR